MHTNSAISARIPAAVALRGAANMQPAGASTAGQPRMLTKGEELFAEGDPADYFYKVVSGSIRTCKLLSDGRRQIDAFHLPGDIFGLEAGPEYRFTAEALGRRNPRGLPPLSPCRTHGH
jgi:CRP/FNR family nitrogen fixation transcriptional regulator